MSTALFSFHFYFLRFFFSKTSLLLYLSRYFVLYPVSIFLWACSAWPLKSIMLGFFGSSLKFRGFFQVPWLLLFSVLLCERITVHLLLDQIPDFFSSEASVNYGRVVRTFFSAFPCVCRVLGCTLCFWVVSLYCDLSSMWSAVFCLAPAILCLQIWLPIPFPPKSVLWQFTCSNDQCKSRVFLRLTSASSPVSLSISINKEKIIQFSSAVTNSGNCSTS